MMELLTAALVLALAATPLVLSVSNLKRRAANHDYWEVFLFRCYLCRLAEEGAKDTTWEDRADTNERVYQEVYGENAPD